MADPEPISTRIHCGEYQPKNEKGEFMPLPELVAVVCRECGGKPVHELLCSTWVCTACDGKGSVLIDKSKLKVMP